jgi:hypothetical protein
LRNIMLRVYSHNLAGLRVYTKVGFREIGRRHESFFMAGHWWDTVYRDCLREYTSPCWAVRPFPTRRMTHFERDTSRRLAAHRRRAGRRFRALMRTCEVVRRIAAGEV